MNASSRHHYIPQFFIKNFTDEDGFLFVYNKAEKRINKNKQSPKSIFYETDRNSIDLGGHKADSLEKLYTELDTKISPDLRNILLTKRVTTEELTSIVLLACLLKWRIPKSDNQFNAIKQTLTQNQLGISITVKDKNTEIDKNAIAHIENSNIFQETKRILLGILPLQNTEHLADIHNNSFIYTSSFFPSLIGDCPVIEKDNIEINKIEDFIMPLSSTDTFIYKQDCKKKIMNNLFFIQRDLAILHASGKYVGCKSKDHLEKMVNIYYNTVSEKMEDNIHKYIFNSIA